MMGKKKGQKKRSASISLKTDIERELRRKTYNRLYREVGFISLEFIKNLYSSGTPTKLHISLQNDMDNLLPEGLELPINNIKIAELKQFVLESAPKLYALLILIGQSQRIIPIFLEAHPSTDHIFEQQNAHDDKHYCSVEFLETRPYLNDIAIALAQNQWIIPPVLCRDNTPKFPRHLFRFPFVQDSEYEAGGAGGEVYSVKVANGHLQTDKPNHIRGIVIAVKEIQISGNTEQALMREVRSIRARRHPNVVEFYASFIAGREDPLQSNEQVDCLHMLFEHADGGNMKDWLTQPTTPSNMVEELTRGNEILRCAQDLVEAVTFIHSNIEGYTCFHHDIKPKNIVRFKGPPATWKLCDFGMANLKYHKDDSATGSAQDGCIGTYEYQPPEYRTEPYPGRSFDVYSLGCIFLELATIWAYGWNDDKLGQFRELRGKNEQNIVTPMPRNVPDYSYHNNPNVVEVWHQQLRRENIKHRCFKQFLDLTADMMRSRTRRIFIWEANLDLFEMMKDRTIQQLKDQLRKIVQPPKTPVNGLDNSHNPLQRAKERGKHWQFKILQDNSWSVDKPQTESLSTLASGQDEHFSTLEACPKNDEYDSNDLFGRHEVDKKISKIFAKSSCVGLYGTSGVGKSHLAYKYVNRFRKAEVFTERKHTFWLEAGTEARLRRTLHKLAESVNLTLTETEDPFIAINRWLSSPSHGSWTMVVDGLDSIAIARLVKVLLPKDVGKTLVTTNCRNILDELPSCSYESCILVDVLEPEARRQLFQTYNKDILATTAEMDNMLQQYSLPIFIKLVAGYLNKRRIPTATWYEGRIKDLEHVLKDDSQYLHLLFPLVADNPYDSNNETGYRQYREFPSAPLKLLAKLSCLDIFEIDLALLEKNYEKREMFDTLYNMLGFLENCNLIGKAEPKGKARNSACYFMHEAVQFLVRRWVVNSMGRRTLLQLHETALCLLVAQYLSDKKKKPFGTIESTYLLKMPFMPHFEKFLQFAQSYEEQINPFPGYECSDNMVQSIITFIHVYLDEGRYKDAECIINFTRKLYRKGSKFKPELARLLAKVYILPPLAKERRPDWSHAVEFLEEVIRDCGDRREVQKQRWMCLLELIELYCRSMRPKEAAQVLGGFREISLQADRNTKRAYLVITKKEAHLGLRDDSDVAKIGIRKKIAEAKIHLTWAKYPTLFHSRRNELNRSRMALEDAKLAIISQFSWEVRWIAEVDESIADVLLEFDNMNSVQEALRIYERISESSRTDLETATTTNRSDRDRGKWRIECKVARAQLRLGADFTRAAIGLLTQTISSYEACYGVRDEKQDEHTRACAYLLYDAYTQTEEIEKAQRTKERYRLMVQGKDYVPYLDVKIRNSFFDCTLPLVNWQNVTCLILLASAVGLFYHSRSW